jgi:hypothetical protein
MISEQRELSSTEAPGAAEPGIGWSLLAGTFLAITGLMNLIWGIAALSNKSAFDEGGLVWLQLDTWGWIAIVVAGLQLLTAGVLYMRQTAGIFLGLTIAVLTILFGVLTLGVYPGWTAMSMIGNALVIWAVTVHRDQFSR